jgi:hypothetical protein
MYPNPDNILNVRMVDNREEHRLINFLGQQVDINLLKAE